MPIEVIPDVYDVTTKRMSPDSRLRVYVFDTETPTLVDTGYEETTGRVIEGLDEIGVTPERLVITHGDDDHVGGYDALVDYYGLETWVPKQMETGGLGNAPDHRYSDGDEIGNFHAVHVPGHTADNHVLVDEAMGVAVLGDAMFGSDRRGLPSGYLIPPPAAFSENLHAAEENLDELLEYDFEVALVFHGSSVTEAASEKIAAFVDFPGRP